MESELFTYTETVFLHYLKDNGGTVYAGGGDIFKDIAPKLNCSASTLRNIARSLERRSLIILHHPDGNHWHIVGFEMVDSAMDLSPIPKVIPQRAAGGKASKRGRSTPVREQEEPVSVESQREPEAEQLEGGVERIMMAMIARLNEQHDTIATLEAANAALQNQCDDLTERLVKAHDEVIALKRRVSRPLDREPLMQRLHPAEIEALARLQRQAPESRKGPD